MLLSSVRGAAASALVIFACAGLAVAGSVFLDDQEARGSSGGEAVTVLMPIDTSGLSALPRFRQVPAMMGEPKPAPPEPAQDLILVPLPAPLWAAASGLSALILVAMWRRHRLRAEH